ncbi:MAG: efflux RND transporter periplasmic adaptor subunit [Candidatus Electryonea clarkiae]|nr:efflux RND transporter periplasmic adaptor subunit [Candidatus Electryonea clarkiae]MDP8286004.1 efflux RND transporter periplasmic adaptor subunit [Candidatus Electryonea clarkiae]
MDRLRDKKDIRTAQRKKLVIISAGIIAAALFIFFLRLIISPSLSRGKIRTAVVERGMVESTISSTGTVIPEFEQVISCPFNTRVLEVIEEPGAQLLTGQKILRLDDRDIRAEVERLRDEIALKKNKREQLAVDLARKQDELRGEIAILKLQIKYQTAKTEQQRALQEKSAATTWSVRQAELDESISTLRLEQLQNELLRMGESTQKQMEGLTIETRLHQLKLQQTHEQMERGIVKAMADGVLTWVADEEGATLREGEVVARIAKLTSFRVEASVSDLHASRLSVGMNTYVEAGNERLTGIISSIPPNIISGVITLIITLDTPDHQSLRSNLRVDVYVITERKLDVLRVKKGPFAHGSGKQDVFILNGKKADRAKARLGISSMDYYEIIEGLNEGETIILSNMDSYKHLDKIRIR